MMKRYTAPIISMILGLINAAACALYLASVDMDIIPTHFDLHMNPDQYGSKWINMATSGIVFLLGILFLVYRAVTKEKENHEKNRKYEDVFLIIISVGFCLLTWFLMLASTDAVSPSRRWLPYLSVVLGVLFILFGNISGKLRQQPNFGIKTYATLNNGTVWRKTHRLSGVIGVIMGFVTILGGIFGMFVRDFEIPVFAVTVVGYVVLSFLVPTVYARVLYNKLGSDKAEAIEEE